MKGSTRKANEDRFDIQLCPGAEAGQPEMFVGVYDGHGGSATAEWLKTQLFGIVQKYWSGGEHVKDVTTQSYLQADKRLLTPMSGFLGMGERGVGGSKCGATSATAMMYTDKRSGLSKLVVANAGDARVLLIRGGQAEQLSVDHVPDEVAERKRIEKFNPNPKMPLVRYVAGTWRVGGLLALSRAFGNAYLKGSMQFEGVVEGSDGYSSGFGVIAEPHIAIVDLTDEDSWLVVSSDGLYAEEERGGGGGLENQQVADILSSAASDADVNTIADAMAKAAMQVGSTDDISVVLVKLGKKAA